MNISDKIFPKPILPNDTRAWLGFEVNGQLLQPQRLAVRDSLTITGLETGKVYEFDMSDYLGHDLLVTGLTADIVADDLNALQEDVNTINRYASIPLIIQVLDRTNKAVKRENVLYITSTTNINYELILFADELYRIKVNKDINSISILGVPVVVSNQVIHNLPTVETTNLSGNNT